MPGSTTLEHVSDGRVIDFLQIIYTSTPMCGFHYSAYLYLNSQRPQMTHSDDSNWSHGIQRNESFHGPENRIQWEHVLQLTAQPLERDRILWRETAGFKHRSPTFYPKLGGAFKVGDVATLIHNRDLEGELAWEGECKCWDWV
jgi:hypothetical protein